MIATLAAAALATAATQPKVEAIRDRFVADLRRCGRTPPPVPTVVPDNAPGMVFYVDRDNTVHYPEWHRIGPQVQQMMAASAAGAPSRPTPQQFFERVFQELLIPHELGHWLEIAGKQDLTWWDSEYRANRIALAYWRLHMSDRAMLRRLSDYWGGMPQKSPVPPGQDVATFFNASKFDPATYGWYQGEMMRRAWAARNAQTFCELIAQQWPSVAR